MLGFSRARARAGGSALLRAPRPHRLLPCGSAGSRATLLASSDRSSPQGQRIRNHPPELAREPHLDNQSIPAWAPALLCPCPSRSLRLDPIWRSRLTDRAEPMLDCQGQISQIRIPRVRPISLPPLDEPAQSALSSGGPKLPCPNSLCLISCAASKARPAGRFPESQEGLSPMRTGR